MIESITLIVITVAAFIFLALRSFRFVKRLRQGRLEGACGSCGCRPKNPGSNSL